MKVIAVIPARYAATRFPGKLMQVLGGKTIILLTYLNTKATGLFNEVIVATDNLIIYDEITKHGGHAVISKKEHESGSDRIAEAIADMPARPPGGDFDIVINVQGDEPFVNKNQLSTLINVFLDDDKKEIKVASLMHKIISVDEIQNPNNVKVVVDKNMDALLFSRSPIPYKRNIESNIDYYKHIGVYAFRKKELLDFTKWPQTILEQTEKLEQLRYLENGIKIRMAITAETTIGIDTEEDLDNAKKYLQNISV